MHEQGSDVVTYPGPSPYLPLRPITSYLKNLELHQELIQLATRALEEVHSICNFCASLFIFSTFLSLSF